MNNEALIKCTKCRQEKPEGQFHARKGKPLDKCDYCKKEERTSTKGLTVSFLYNAF